MISLCQDVSISYEYHVYQNQTIKKVIHKRNGSNFSEKTFIKTPKLTLVSKDKQKLRITAQDDTRVLPNKKPCNPPMQKKNKHKRCWSNHVDTGICSQLQTRVEAAQISQNKFNSYSKNIAPSFQLKKDKNRPQVYFNQTIQQKLPQQKIFFKPSNQKFYANPEQLITFNGIISSGNIRPTRYLQIQKEKMLRIQPFNSSLYDSQEEIFEKSNIKHTRANSFTTYQTALKQNLQKIESSTMQDFTSMEKQFIQNYGESHLHQRQNSLNLEYQYPKMASSLSGQCHQIRPTYSFKDFYTPKQDVKKFREDYDNPPKSPMMIQNENIFDAESTVSKNLNDENDSESTSVVQQRNFFYQKQQQPVRFFNKSIQNLLFLEPAQHASNKKWILFKNVQDKDNKKMYSVKQFSNKNEKQYLNEYEIYLALKGKTSHYMFNSRENNKFLNLFNVISNTQHQKLHLIKENFQYSLKDHINHLKTQSRKSSNPQKFLEIEEAVIKRQIKEIFTFFMKHDIELSQQEQIEIQDFVMSRSLNEKFTVKFHNLYKLQKKTIEKLKFSKFSKLKKDYQQTFETLEQIQKGLALNLRSIQRKIFSQFFLV